jgi:hypothetical protein
MASAAQNVDSLLFKCSKNCADKMQDVWSFTVFELMSNSRALLGVLFAVD